MMILRHFFCIFDIISSESNLHCKIVFWKVIWSSSYVVPYILLKSFWNCKISYSLIYDSFHLGKWDIKIGGRK
ncbi:hypothetical protein RJT34_12354 [Clitoria ternatea]|uniref:Uncharacterized protein n=1 Tax=Clitoria ternatea TaxID=43366 RepID=A0AAN9PKV0_CLITE